MTPRAITFLTAFFLLFSLDVQSNSQSESLSTQQLLHLEIELNAVATSVYLLQLDFLDHDARDSLQQAQLALDNRIQSLPSYVEERNLTEQLKAIKTFWTMASKYISWLSKLPSGSDSPEVNTLMSYLVRMNHQFLIMRQHLTDGQQSYPFLEQALLIQQITRDYMVILVAVKNGEGIENSQLRLKEMVTRFDERLRTFDKALAQHTHAGQSVHEAWNTWQYIQKQYNRAPESPMPDLMIRYSNRITNRLYSLHRMF